MPSERPTTVLCIASYEKGFEFLTECKQLGCRVFLVTLEQLADSPWPRDHIDEVYYMPAIEQNRDLVHAISYLARHEHIDTIVPLDDFDVESAAMLREHLRSPGMGNSTARYFRDKLAMRVKARSEGILVPEFCHVLNYEDLQQWMDRVEPPWVLKPRSEASSVGITKLHNQQELWPTLDALGDRQSYYVLEQYVPGDVYHVDSIVWDREALFSETHKYATPPLDVMHGGGIFASHTLDRYGEDASRLRELDQRLLTRLGLVRGVTHTEYIKGRDDGQFYFLETSARVGGANIADMVEAATGVNLWREWARIEVAAVRRTTYHLPQARNNYAGILISLARQEWPDTGAYDDPEIVWRMKKLHHAGLIIAAEEQERVIALLDGYMRRFAHDFMATLPAPDRPTS